VSKKQEKGIVLTGSTSADTLGVVALLQETVDTTDRELETSFGRAGLGLGFTACTRSLARLGFATDFARHYYIVVVVERRRRACVVVVRGGRYGEIEEGVHEYLYPNLTRPIKQRPPDASHKTNKRKVTCVYIYTSTRPRRVISSLSSRPPPSLHS
jgi:hypothetical protein